MNITRNIKKGDIYYIEISKRYFFMQVIHEKIYATPYDEGYKHGYFTVVFEKSFKMLPKSTAELDLQTIYKVKDRPKETILYVSIWDNEPEIKVSKWSENFKRYSKFKLHLFGNAPVAEKFNYDIVMDFYLPAQCTYDENAIQISHSPHGIAWIYYMLESDLNFKNKKTQKIETKFLKSWLEDVEPDAIVKTEKALTIFEADEKDPKKALKKCIVTLNKWNDKLNFIHTIEREDLYEILIKIALKKDLTEQIAQDLIDQNRDW